MKRGILFLTAAPLALAMPAYAAHAASASAASGGETAAVSADAAQEDTKGAASGKAKEEVFSTGVAKGRDILDSAISTSSLKSAEINKLGARSLAEILRTLPGIRVEASSGEGNSNYTIRGLPLASGGSKYLQIEEDGLPVLEFGDVFNAGSDVFIRADLNLAAIEAIRGGSASTFASNSPGGVINLISKTGDAEGGTVEATTGLDYGEKRIDFEYGTKLSETLRFHVGGFYRSGEGPRDIGYNGYRGGQVKFNVTRQFESGFVRLYGKLLDDRSPQYVPAPVMITGTDKDPDFKKIANFDPKKDSLLSSNIGTFLSLDRDNQPVAENFHAGMHAKSKSVGLEAQFEIAGWSVTERARYSANSGDLYRLVPGSIAPAATIAAATGGAGATLRYAGGPNSGQAITDLAGLNGNGLLASVYLAKVKLHALDNFTNDLRANRVWKLGAGDLTVTAGLYKSMQTIDMDWLYSTAIQDVIGGGKASLVDVVNAAGTKVTQNGYSAFSIQGLSLLHRAFNVDYDITAPYGSINYRFGKIAIGGSVRYDIGSVNGQVYGADLGGGRPGITSVDFNRDGVISVAESRTAILPLTQPSPVNYDYGYLSYSAGINYRIAEPLAIFARYSRGARANADKILFTSAIDYNSGDLPDSSNAYDTVKQLEGGVKFRQNGLALNLTGFHAKSEDDNIQSGSGLGTSRLYRAYGAEFEGSFRRGPFSLNAGATYTKAKITKDFLNAAVTGLEPRHQPEWTFQLMPQVSTRYATFGASSVTVTSSYAQDTDQLRMPGFTVVNAFVQFHPTERVQLSVNANNLFNTLGYYEISQATVPANGIGWGRANNGRTISTSLSLSF
ncbi:TonB-dependent receptor domain-containing protein [Sphingosinicella sp. BN140058]|uniref:TonB-dependent receptor domain-containing protein n=1 Tax=Sphingosinicella sp. BN140058 TaxID=1892855 RepID=UPI0010112571|nr:TonB-dependent receptor [Sphingosinicella sp. BN140058]QAY78738.1 TonB-dependent receptor [Sphingosinicella sp. BN140058]